MMAAMKLQHHDMTLKQLLSNIIDINCLPDLPITGLSLDSRYIKPGNLFVALQGDSDHGLVFADEAVTNGAVAVLCDRQFDDYCQQVLSSLMTRAVCIPVANLQEKLGRIASLFYAEPSKDMFTVGVTGTDGKTSVSHFIAQALHQKDQACAVLGTIGNGLIGQLDSASHTTPDVINVHRLFAEFAEQGAKQLAMEVSSHGLDQGRVDAVDFDVAVLTNLGRDHLDYHGDVKNYQAAKYQLFKQPGLKAAVVNLDDEFGRQLAAELTGKMDVWAYSLDADASLDDGNLIKASAIEVQANGIKMQVVTPKGPADFKLNLLGRFNASNALACLAVLLIKGVPCNDAVQRLEQLTTVTGRMQCFGGDNKPLVVVDYAHTPQALTCALQTLREHCSGKLTCVFGCGGDRDQGKRPLMAQAAEQYADSVIVTDDNPRTESAEAIVQMICGGFSSADVAQVIHDRGQAIAHAIDQARENDIILIAGKGHETFQMIGAEKKPFSDCAWVEQQLVDQQQGDAG